VLVAGDAGGQGVRRVMLGLGLGGVYQFLMEGFGLWATKPSWRIRGVPGAEIGGEVSPALLGVGYVLGPRIAGSCWPVARSGGS